MKEKKVFNIMEHFSQLRYGEITEIVDSFYGKDSSIRDLNLSIEELSAITHSYFEVEKYERAIAFGNYTIDNIPTESRNTYKEDLELVMLDLIVSYEKLGQYIQQYRYLLKYKEFSLYNNRVEGMLNSVEARFSTWVIRGINALSFTFIGLTYLLDPPYRHTVFYFLFVALFFVQMVLNYIKTDQLNGFYRKLVRWFFSSF